MVVQACCALAFSIPGLFMVPLDMMRSVCITAEQGSECCHILLFLQMIEPELAFADLAANMACATAFLKHCVRYILEHCQEDLQFFDSFVEKGLVSRLQVGQERLASLTH